MKVLVRCVVLLTLASPAFADTWKEVVSKEPLLMELISAGNFTFKLHNKIKAPCTPDSKAVARAIELYARESNLPFDRVVGANYSSDTKPFVLIELNGYQIPNRRAINCYGLMRVRFEFMTVGIPVSLLPAQSAENPKQVQPDRFFRSIKIQDTLLLGEQASFYQTIDSRLSTAMQELFLWTERIADQKP